MSQMEKEDVPLDSLRSSEPNESLLPTSNPNLEKAPSPPQAAGVHPAFYVV